MFQKRRCSKGSWRATQPYSLRKLQFRNQRRALLLVDDDEQVLRVARRLLENEWEIHTAKTATEAAGILKKRKFDTVLTDYEMPGKDGIWLLSEVKRICPNTRRVLFSGSRPFGLFDHLTSGVVDCFLPKPTSRAELASSLEE